MKVLLVHPEDSPQHGPWAAQRWDLIVDLGRSSTLTASAWCAHAACPVLRLDSFRHGVADVKQVKQLYSAGRGVLIDRGGIDWWDIFSLYFLSQAETVLALQRLCAELGTSPQLWATRSGWLSTALASLLGQPIHYFPRSWLSKLSCRAAHYAGLTRRFSSKQIQEIALDKYDPGYRLRARVVRRATPLSSPVVLIPSAYENVSRMASAYARLVPEVKFLLVATRRSATLFDPPPNVTLRHLSSYASYQAPEESADLLDAWAHLQSRLTASPEFCALGDAGVFSAVPMWLTDGLSLRDAWTRVLDSEPVSAVLCGDDSNSYTRLPMLLAVRRGLPTLDFHHGALDGFYLVKHLECGLYLAKSEMERDYLTRVCQLPAERIALAAPGRSPAPTHLDRKSADAIILFSEPYENVGARGHDIYAEILPRLARLARARGGHVIVKLHPFESMPARSALLRSVVSSEDQSLFTVVDGPLTDSLLGQAWFGLTVESTTAMDCALNGVPCFLCGWLTNSSFGYADQYARFGLGSVLNSAADIETIPTQLAAIHPGANLQSFWSPADPAQFARWLAGPAIPPSPLPPHGRQNIEGT
jgi:hypothetical protein